MFFYKIGRKYTLFLGKICPPAGKNFGTGERTIKFNNRENRGLVKS